MKAVAGGGPGTDRLGNCEAEGVTRSFVNRLLRLTLLAPDIQEAILDGRQPKGMQLEELTRTMPSGWHEQRQQLMHPAKISSIRQHIVSAGGFAVSAILAQRALSMELLPSDGIGETSDAKSAMVGAQQATDDPDLAWLGAAICISSAVITCGCAYLLTDILFFDPGAGAALDNLLDSSRDPRRTAVTRDEEITLAVLMKR